MSQEPPHPEHSGETITILKVDPILEDGVVVTSAAMAVSGRLADRHSAYFDNLSPPLNWTDVAGVKTWAIVVEDPDAPQEHPFVHWMVWNIEGGVLSLAEGLPKIPYLETPQGGIQGRNSMGGHGWFGPRPPAAHGQHHYYIQVFALADSLNMGPDAPLGALLNALKGLTLAKGEMVVTYEAPAPH